MHYLTPSERVDTSKSLKALDALGCLTIDELLQSPIRVDWLKTLKSTTVYGRGSVPAKQPISIKEDEMKIEHKSFEMTEATGLTKLRESCERWFLLTDAGVMWKLLPE